MKFLLVLASLSLAACSSSSPPAQVDASAADAPRLPPPDAPGPTVCSSADPTSCSGETICVGTTCEPAFNRIYSFSQISVTVATNNPGGSAWDPFGGAPDPQVTVKLNGMQILQTSVASNTFAASYSESVDQEIVGGSTLELDVQDSDVGGADDILDCTFDPLTADQLRQAIVQCIGTGTQDGSTITMHVDVKG